MKSESAKEILSLRNIYRFLMVMDYPIHSNGILRDGKRKGLTLVSFWQENLIEEFKNGDCGRVIWRKEGGRNRYTSEICNRNLNSRFYRKYKEELLEQCQPALLLKQVRRFFYFLKERQYDADAFNRKLPEFLKLIGKEDALFPQEIYFLLSERIGTNETPEKTGLSLSYKLTILSLLALMGEEMGSEEVILTFCDKACGFKSLWEIYLAEKTNQSVRIHHAPYCHLTENVLSSEHFFGRQRELFDLREKANSGGKYLLRGIGGVGKTELIRQFIRMCIKEKLADEMVLITYADSFSLSLERAFNIYRTKENNEKEAWARFLQLSYKKLIVIVDGVNCTEKEDESLSLLRDMPGTVFVTGRISSLLGFTRYEINPPDLGAGMLIFRDNCRRKLNQDELFWLEELLKKPLFCHTLTLRLLGRLAINEGLNKNLFKSKGRTEKERYKVLLGMYRKLYSLQGFSKEEELVLKTLSLLPYRVYPISFVNKFIEDYRRLVDLGWIMLSEDGVILHPVIAESIRSDKLDAKDYEDFFFNMKEKMWNSCKEWAGESFDKDSRLAWGEYSLMAPMELFEDAENVFHMAFLLGEGFSQSQRETILMAFELLSDFVSVQVSEEDKYREFFLRILSEAKDEKEALRIRCNLVDITTDEDELKICIEKLKKENVEIANYYRIKFALLLAYKGKFQDSLDLLMKVHKETDSQIFLIWAESNLEGILHKCGRDQGELFGEINPTEKAWERVCKEGNRFINGQLRAFLLFNLANHRLNQNRLDDAKEAFVLFEEALNKGKVKDLYLQGTYYYLRGTILVREQDYMGACEYLEKAKELVALYPQAKSMEAFYTEELAVAQDKAGRFSEAEKNHLFALNIFEGSANEPEGAYRTNANLASLYLAWERPKEALKHLNRCLFYEEKEPALKQGMGHGVVMGHFSKVYYALGDNETSASYGTIAKDLLEKFLGKDHEKVREIREILEKCTKVEMS